MFFEGSLNDGIALALKEQKLVLCFVTQDQGESLKWESWLKNDEDLVSSISATSVLLRLTAGGQEATYLSAFCPILSVPALIVIQNGVPTAHLKPPLAENEFKTAVIDATSGRNLEDRSAGSVASAPPALVASNVEHVSETFSSAPHPSPEPTITSDTRSTAEASPSSIKSPKDKAKEDQVKRAAEIKKAQSDALAERKRVLAQIENDKKERRLREQEQKWTAREEERQTAEASKQSQIAARKNHKDCALKIRTFDGSTISSIFPSEQTLQQHVRPWIDSELGTVDAPYEFKQVLVPMPSRKINASEEEESLRDLGFAPNATLVMVPVQSYSNAYGTNASGVVGSSLSYGYGLVSGGLGLAGNLVGSLLGRGAESTPVESTSRDAVQQPDPPNTSNFRVRTLADQRHGQDDQQLYNGNQLNFERRKDDEDRQ